MAVEHGSIRHGCAPPGIGPPGSAIRLTACNGTGATRTACKCTVTSELAHSKTPDVLARRHQLSVLEWLDHRFTKAHHASHRIP